MRDNTDDHTDLSGPDRDHRTGAGVLLSLVPGRDVAGVHPGGSARPGHRPARRRAARGPRPVRPAARPAPACRMAPRGPERAWPEQRSGGRERVPVRVPRRPSEPPAWRFRVRRAVAVAVGVLVTAAFVVGLGLLADTASAARHAPGGERAVTVGSLAPVPEVSGQVPGAPGR